MTDEELRVRLRTLRGWGVPAFALPILGAAQVGATFLLFGDGSTFTAGSAYFALGFIPIAIAIWAFQLHRDTQFHHEGLRRRYVDALTQAHMFAQRARAFSLVWLGLTGFMAYVLASTPIRSSTPGSWAGLNLAICLLAAHLYQWRRTLPRLERARLEFLADAQVEDSVPCISG